MLIGEAPGATEDELGRPFVGAAGRLLTMVLESVGVPRSSVYITNVVKCRPPGNREPKEEEIEACSPYLESQITLLKPKVIVTLGNVAGKWVFSKAKMKWSGVTKMRGRTYRVSLLGIEVVVIPTIHPAAALYNPSMRNALVEDLKRIKDVLSESIESLKSRPMSPRTLLDYFKKKES